MKLCNKILLTCTLLIVSVYSFASPDLGEIHLDLAQPSTYAVFNSDEFLSHEHKLNALSLGITGFALVGFMTYRRRNVS